MDRRASLSSKKEHSIIFLLQIVDFVAPNSTVGAMDGTTADERAMVDSEDADNIENDEGHFPTTLSSEEVLSVVKDILDGHGKG